MIVIAARVTGTRSHRPLPGRGGSGPLASGIRRGILGGARVAGRGVGITAARDGVGEDQLEVVAAGLDGALRNRHWLD